MTTYNDMILPVLVDVYTRAMYCQDDRDRNNLHAAVKRVQDAFDEIDKLIERMPQP